MRPLHHRLAARRADWRWSYDGGLPLAKAKLSAKGSSRKVVARALHQGAGRAGHRAAAADQQAGAQNARGQRPRRIRRQNAGLGLEGRKGRQPPFPRLPVERPRYAQVVTRRSPPANDRILQLRAGDLPGHHRPARRGADLFDPDPGRHRRAAARDGHSLGVRRLDHPDGLRAARPADSRDARNQPCQLPDRRRDPAVLPRLRNGLRPAQGPQGRPRQAP